MIYMYELFKCIRYLPFRNGYWKSGMIMGDYHSLIDERLNNALRSN